MLIAAELLKKFIVFLATPVSITVFTRTLHGPHSGPHQFSSNYSILMYCNIHFNISIPSKLKSLSRPLNCAKKKTLHAFSFSPMHGTYRANLTQHRRSSFCYTCWTNIQITKVLVMQFLRPPITSSFNIPNILLRSSSKNREVYSCFAVTAPVLQPYNTTGKITI